MFPRARRIPAPAKQAVFSSAPHGLPVSDPDLGRLMWMEELREFLREPGIDLSDLTFLESKFIEYCTDWHGQPTIGRWNPRTVMNALGVALGDCLRQQIPGARWQLTSAHGASYLVITAADGLIVAAPLTEMTDHWIARELTWVSGYPGAVLNRLPQPRDPGGRSTRRERPTPAIPQPQI